MSDTYKMPIQEILEKTYQCQLSTEDRRKIIDSNAHLGLLHLLLEEKQKHEAQRAEIVGGILSLKGKASEFGDKTLASLLDRIAFYFRDCPELVEEIWRFTDLPTEKRKEVLGD